MSSPQHRGEANKERQAARDRVSICESALMPFSAEQVTAMANQRQAESVPTPGMNMNQTQTPQHQPSYLDFGNFKTGNPQYSHAHWNSANVSQAATIRTPQSANRIAVDPASLRPDTDSLRAEICSNASSTSLSTCSDRTVAGMNMRSPNSKPSAPNSPYAAMDSTSPSSTNALSNDAGNDENTDSLIPAATTSSQATNSLSDAILTKAVAKIEIHDFADNKSDCSTTTVKGVVSTENKTSEQRNNTTITRQYPLLKKRPPPILTDHPAFGSDPFTSASDSPRLSSSWTPAQLRTYNENQKPKQEEAKPARNNLLDIVRASSHDDELLSLSEAAKEGPPPPTPKSARSSSISRLPRPRTASVNSTTPPTKRFSPFSFRGVSNVLSPRQYSSKFDRIEYRENQEKYLRTVTNTLPRPNASMFPAHPATSRNWMHRNLRCTECTDATCAKCGKACCAWKAASRGIANQKGEGKERAIKLKGEIELAGPFGRELPTFLKCSDCEKMVCPDCCGECCDEICRLVCCRACKSDPWAACDFHREH